MKKQTIWIVAVVLIAAFNLAGPGVERAEAIPVHDAVHFAETVASTVEDLRHYLDMWKSAYEKITNPFWRDLLVKQLVERTLEAAKTGVVSYAVESAGDILLDAFPGAFVFASLEGETGELLTAGKLNKDWSSWARDAQAGALQSASVHAEDYAEVLRGIEELQALADSAAGTSQSLHVGNQLSAVIALEQVKAHQMLAALVQSGTVARAHEITERASAEATARAFISGELNVDEPEEARYVSEWPF